MCVFGHPLFHFNGEPECIDAEGNDGEKEPFDVVAEELATVAIEVELSAVDDGMFCEPTFLHANCPGECDAEGADCE